MTTLRILWIASGVLVRLLGLLLCATARGVRIVLARRMRERNALLGEQARLRAFC
ncbi:hypothetical protein EXIGLDRAFT_726284 [Exidia glandulosa HHB12029]|uniref:Uncharacterized protein n=1 Tax=Exidia glandulosa HHB12029 TaxID=1314781 RepID=A0A165DTK9_EXIGL|nr:hypothetical protein EXIGLDRAFT_726284 [Exidia glandulosa HHB12029]